MVSARSEELLALAERMADSFPPEPGGLEERDSWGDPSTPTRRVFGYLEGAAVETIWWSRELAEEHFDRPGADQALLHGVPVRSSGLLGVWRERLAAYPDELA